MGSFVEPDVDVAVFAGAPCAADPEAWFPMGAHDESFDPVKKVCIFDCDLLELCASYAAAVEPSDGVWAGLDALQWSSVAKGRTSPEMEWGRFRGRVGRGLPVSGGSLGFVGMRDLVERTCFEFEAKVDSVMGRQNGQKVGYVRRECWLRLRDVGCSFADIGRLFDRSESTIRQALKGR